MNTDQMNLRKIILHIEEMVQALTYELNDELTRQKFNSHVIQFLQFCKDKEMIQDYKMDTKVMDANYPRRFTTIISLKIESNLDWVDFKIEVDEQVIA